jgi:predicted dehydrogenase
METREIRVTINGTGFAADYTSRVYAKVPHKNGVAITLAGVTSGRFENAVAFARKHEIEKAFADHAEMVRSVRPHIDNVACANDAHGRYVIEAAKAGVNVIVLEKPPVIWPGYAADRQADAAQRKRETMEYLAEVLDSVRSSKSKLLYAEDFVYVDGVKGVVELLIEAQRIGKGKVLLQRGICAHQGSHAPAYDTPAKSGGGALFNKACHPLGPCLFLKQVEGLLRDGRPIRPSQVSAVALQILKYQPNTAHEHFRVMQHVDDFARITVIFDDQSVAEVHGHDLSISGIRNEISVITDFAQYDIRINPNNENELFLPKADAAGNLLFREKLPTSQGTSFPRPNQLYSHGYINEINDAVDCALNADRYPQSGALMAWDTSAVLMAGYESASHESRFVDVNEYCQVRQFTPEEMPDPHTFGQVFQRV